MPVNRLYFNDMRWGERLLKDLKKTKWFIFGTYILLVLATLLVGFFISKNNTIFNNVIGSFLEVTENRTFDYRQSLKIFHKKPIADSDIVILAIDEASLEKLWNKYGIWPFPRDVYADLINYLEQGNPKAIVFDLMFLKKLKTSNDGDRQLIQAINSNQNVIVAMNFDDQNADVRTPITLPKRLAVNLKNNSNIKISTKSHYTNCRTILPELVNGKAQIGIANVQRSSDGILRRFSPLMEYQNNYYPYLSFLAGNNILNNNNKDFVIDEKGNLIVGETLLPLTKEGEVILNWYGKKEVTYENIPLYKIIESMEHGVFPEQLKNKIIFIGTTAMSLHDTKSVPIQNEVYPGIEVHATFLNNMIDNNFIKQSSNLANNIVIVVVFMLVGLIVMTSTSTFFTVLSTILFTFAYLLISYYSMALFNLWIPIVTPILSIVLAFILSLLAKYLIKSRDFEYQYKLATVDGLTELYNHRYFQESLKNQIEVAKRYNQSFSLMIIDIDFFKKFNDTYGHQSGDAVLRQVAQTLKKNSRNTDIVCRYGGEEMSIILPNTSAEEVMYSATRVLTAIAEKEFHLKNNATSAVTVSIGIATFPEDAETPQSLIEVADKGLYYAKEHGRNQVGKI